MVIECPACRITVDSKVLSKHMEPMEPDEPFPGAQTVFLECPRCKGALVGIQEAFEDEEGATCWPQPTRVWPSPKRALSSTLPPIVRLSIEEADKCFQIGAHLACAVMCGRTLEGICRHFGTKSQQLGGGLKELLEKETIDRRLYEWGEALREQRNLAAHATDEKISREDAGDLLDFAVAICDYIFVLNEKFQDFTARRTKSARHPSTRPAKVLPVAIKKVGEPSS